MWPQYVEFHPTPLHNSLFLTPFLDNRQIASLDYVLNSQLTTCRPAPANAIHRYGIFYFLLNPKLLVYRGT